MRGLPQKQNARRADKIKLCGHLRRYKKIVKKTYIIYYNPYTKSITGDTVFPHSGFLHKSASNAILRKIAYLAGIPFPEFLLMLVGDISPNP